MFSQAPGRLIVWSPRKRRLAMLRRYQALGKARISLSRLMSYLKEAEPMSHTAEGRRMHLLTKEAPLKGLAPHHCRYIVSVDSLKPGFLISALVTMLTVQTL